MFWFGVGGPINGPVASVTWTAGGEPQALSAASIAQLNTPLDFEGGAARAPRSSVRLAGVVTVTFDLAPFALPPQDVDQGIYVEPVLHLRARDLAALRADGLAYDPVPTSTDQNRRTKLTRIIGGYHVTWVPDAGNPAIGELTLPADGVEVVRLASRLYGWRDYWQPCG